MEGFADFNMKPASVTRPSDVEIAHLHRELAIWAKFSRYSMTEHERMPIYRAQNTAFLLGSGAGIGAYFAVRFRSPRRFPYDMMLGLAAYTLTEFVAGTLQRRSMYNSILSMPSPLGEKARGILMDMRQGGADLPSKTYASQMRVPGQAQPQRAGDAATPSPLQPRPKPRVAPAQDDTPASTLDAAETFKSAAPSPGEVTPPDGTSSTGWSSASAEQEQQPPQTQAQSGAGWSMPDTSVNTAAGGGLDAPPAWPSSSKPSGERVAPSRTTWEEIRARNAANGGGGGSS
mmetsp:Transcript_18163/g.42460  ORF Transcript_18163/g.42460 Transcript_18163/m.42460 type:complete len:288 (+) Transcript_18163:78-941(+)